jgi:hypothetical protein
MNPKSKTLREINAFMLHVFNPLTTDTGGTWLLPGEYGAVAAALGMALVVLFSALCTHLPQAAPARTMTP